MSFPSFFTSHPDYVFIALVVLILDLAVAATAQRRGRSGALYFFLSLMLTPVVTFCIVAAVGPRSRGAAISIPESQPDEPPLTQRQQRELLQLGVTDPMILEGVGIEQAESILMQMRSAGDHAGSLTPLFGLFACGAVAIVVIHWHFTTARPTGDSDSPVTADIAAPAGGEAPPVDPKEIQPFSPAPMTWSGPLVVTMPVIAQARYGQVIIPAGTEVKLISVGNGRLRIQYGDDIANIPTSATNYPR